MKIYDITRTLQDAPLYPGAAAPCITQAENQNGVRTAEITMSSHCGTHADAFSHFLPDGASIDCMPLENYCGQCRVLTVPQEELVTLDDLRGRLGGAERLALRSGGVAFLCEEAAEYIVSCGIRALVTDSVSVGPSDNEAAIHGILMNGGVAIIENAVFDGVEDGDYLLFAFPMKYGGCDGAPVRAVLLLGGEAKASAETDAQDDAASETACETEETVCTEAAGSLEDAKSGQL